MKHELATKVMAVLQQFYIEQKKHFNLFLRGEDTVLIYLLKKSEAEIVTPSEISRKLKVSTARVAASLNGLESKGLITREIDLSDRRKIIIRLSDVGRKRAENLIAAHIDKVNSILIKVGEKDTNKFIEIVENVIMILKEEDNVKTY